MTGSAVRLEATRQGPQVFLFSAEFAAPAEAPTASDAAHGDDAALPAQLITGDGASYNLGLISAPTDVTWREQRRVALGQHRYAGDGPYTAELRLGGVTAASTLVQVNAPHRQAALEAPAEDGPALFAIAPIADQPFQRLLRLHAGALRPGERLRVDGGAGQVRELAGEDGQDLIAEMVLSYPKPGTYLVSVELLDGAGFWLETLAQTPLEIGAGEAETPTPELSAPPAGRVPLDAGAWAAVPWLPYRNFKAKPQGARTYSSPGGGSVRRYAGAGLWMTARGQTTVGGVTWYQTAGGDWIRADAVDFFEPSTLQGVILDDTAPPPPPPPPLGNRRGVVTASALNVRRRPGVTADNPPIDVLRTGVQVTIFEERAAGGEVWYRIGSNAGGGERWVIAKWVQLLPDSRGGTAALRAAGAVALPFGWVTPETVDVRAKPGVASNNPVTGQLHHYDVRPVLQTVTASGAAWHQIGADAWVEARKMGVARLRPRPVGIPAGALWVAVNLSQQTVVCYEGDKPVFAALAATGVANAPTVQGIFKTWRRLDTGKMAGPGYYIEDVTWTCYFYAGYALHTAYWHDKFGSPRSHGCVNLSPHDAWWIYQWSARGGPNSPMVYVYWS